VTNPPINSSKSAYDYLDILIIRTLAEQFAQKKYHISTKEISNKLEQRISPRTIRYRLTKMEQKGIFRKKVPFTHERKLGIGEKFILFEENPAKRETLYTLLDKITPFDWYVPTYGKYNGYYMHSIYELKQPHLPDQIMLRMKEKALIHNFFLFDVVDLQQLGWNFSYFDENGNWTWSWDIWKSHLMANLNSEEIFPIVFEPTMQSCEFDTIDLNIIQNIYSSDIITYKELAPKLNLSETQVGRRIKSLEQKGIIRGYRIAFYPFTNMTHIFIFLSASKTLPTVLYHLSQIPYPTTIAYESSSRIAVAIEMPLDELNQFLGAFYSLKPLLESYFFQLLPQPSDINLAGGLHFYEETTNSWRKLTDEYQKVGATMEKL
jgi:DNA-binding Lrp family transcriptional regulator